MNETEKIWAKTRKTLVIFKRKKMGKHFITNDCHKIT